MSDRTHPRRQGAVALLGALAAVAVVWGVRSTYVPGPLLPTPPPRSPPARAIPSPAPAAAPVPRLPPPGPPSDAAVESTAERPRLRTTTLFFATSSEGSLWSETRLVPRVSSGPGFIQELDARYGGAPDPWMVSLLDAADTDLNGVAWLGSGLSPWSDLLLLRSASFVAWGVGDAHTRDEMRQLIDDAALRWPNHPDVAALVPMQLPLDGQADWARELIDRGRSGERLPWMAANIAASYLERSGAEAPQPADHDRFRWIADAYPEHRPWTVALAIGFALKARHPTEAAGWLEALEALESEERRALHLGWREVDRLRRGVVAIGGLAPWGWGDEVAAQTGTCFDVLSPRRIGAFVSVLGVWQDGELSWSPTLQGSEPWSSELASCLAEREVEPPEEGDCALGITFPWGI